MLTPAANDTYCYVEDMVTKSEFLATDPEVRVRFPALPDFLRNSGSGTGSTQPREYSEEIVAAPV
jgi:hypothetical protein